jgi:hypothetical protein
VIVLSVRWYLRFALSYRDVEELLAERGIEVDHTTVYGWVRRFAPRPAPQQGRGGGSRGWQPTNRASVGDPTARVLVTRQEMSSPQTILSQASNTRC